MKELSIFIDESGDFGEYDYHSPYFIITMVFHNQQEDIQPAILKLNRELSYLNLDNLCIHTRPIIEFLTHGSGGSRYQSAAITAI